MANGTTSFWDYVYDAADYISEQVSDAYKYVTSAETYKGISYKDIVGTRTSAERMKLLNRPSARGTGSRSGGKYSGGFLDYASDVYEAGKDVARWSGQIIKSDGFKETMAYINKLRIKGAGTPIPDIPLPDTRGRGGYKSAPISGFSPTQGGRKSNMPKSYGMIQNITSNPEIMERIRNEVSSGRWPGYDTASRRNISSKAQLGAISVRNPYAGTRISTAKPAL